VISANAFRESRENMSLIYSIGALVSVGLMIYLAVALLKPEWYS